MNALVYGDKGNVKFSQNKIEKKYKSFHITSIKHIANFEAFH